jgi:outer membrane protein
MNKRILWVTLPILCWILGLPPAGYGQKTMAAGQFGKIDSGSAVTTDWHAISELDLEAAVAIALADNPGLEAAAARLDQARARVDQARAGYWPRLDAHASGARVDQSDNVIRHNLAALQALNPATAIENPEDFYRTELSAAWTLFNGFERKFANASARYGEQSSAAAWADARRQLVAAVARSFFSSQLALENIEIAKADERFNQRQLIDAEARQRMGTGPLSDVLNFQVRQNQAQTVRINQEYQYAVARYGLAALLGVPGSWLPAHVELARLAPETAAELSAPPVDELVAAAMDRRPDIQQAQWEIKQVDAQIKIVQADYYPSVVLAGSIGAERAGDAGFGRDDFGNRVQVSLSYNLFAGGLTQARVRENRQRMVELENSLEERALAVTAEVRSSAALVVAAQTQVVLQRASVDLVQRTRDLVEKEYQAGQGSLVRLNEAQRDLITAQGSLALALAGLRQAWVELEARAGLVPIVVDPSDASDRRELRLR